LAKESTIDVRYAKVPVVSYGLPPVLRDPAIGGRSRQRDILLKFRQKTLSVVDALNRGDTVDGYDNH
jgi:hypothetical protein